MAKKKKKKRKVVARKDKRGAHLKKVKYSFKPVADLTLKQVYGTKPITPAEITKSIWKVVKKHDLRVA